jgi:O-acetyl-ADP-ribose deacetylase (regulator of RNase III)
MIRVTDNDITATAADVIVNSGNHALGGIGPDLPDGVGGVDGAIHRAAGIELWRHLQALPFVGELRPGWPARCWPGQCVVTPAFRLPAAHIVHGVAPHFDEAEPEKCFAVLVDLYRNIFQAIEQLGAKSVLIPPIGTSSYGFPLERSAAIAMAAACAYVEATRSLVEFTVIRPHERLIYNTILSAEDALARPVEVSPEPS